MTQELLNTPVESPAPASALQPNSFKDRLTAALSFTHGVVPLVVAILVLWYFGTLIKRMFGLTSPNITELEWGRNTYLYAGIEALAYAAAGFLFGKEVHRQQAEKAEANADRSQQVANNAQMASATNKANGRTLANSIRRIDDMQSMHTESSAPSTSDAFQVSIKVLRAIADSHFPER